MERRLSEYVACMGEKINTHTSCWRNLRGRGHLKNKMQVVGDIETYAKWAVCIRLEWIDLVHIRIGGESVWLRQWTVRCSERRRTAWVVDGRFASRVDQIALGCTELHKRCVQEQSSRSMKLSTNLRLMPSLRSCGTYSHFPIRFHREQFKMSFRAICVSKKIFFSETWRYLLWQMNTDDLDLPTAFISWLFLHFEGGDSRYLRNVDTRILLSNSQQTLRLTASDVMTWTHSLSRSSYYNVDLQRVTWFCSLKCPFVSA